MSGIKRSIRARTSAVRLPEAVDLRTLAEDEVLAVR